MSESKVEHKPLVKICGLQDVEVLKSMKHLTVDFIGFVFARSKRQVTAAQAADLVNLFSEWEVRPLPKSVGVFVNPKLEEVEGILEQVSLDVIQLHGGESPEFCRELKARLGVEVFKVFSLNSNPNELEEDIEATLAPYQGAVDAILIDTFDPLYGGGSGKTFAWDRSLPYQIWARKMNIPLFVAGGLQPDNVNELVNSYSPDGVDVSSGVETNGIKDINKMTAFVERVKKA
ncbi:phosphoribosylanthranilate isomerase [Paenibacillus sp. Marseille-Q4541]|uniref:phosphoribosylanthranilate isomerase n=1 Tax=Paenibacillus sp. Marseille-Q4541 TaxID=2831522 RepID=UPI001BA9136D|nr:phosphoribosylanthranilate isomerase [Paenibacillus sp. Marseille-Q4541]